MTPSERPENECLPASLELRLPPLLSVIVGLVDVLGFFMLGRIFAAHVTGNLIVATAVAAQGEAPSFAQILAIPVFMLAVAAMWLLAWLSRRRGERLVRLLLGLQFVLLAGLFVFAVTTNTSANPNGLAAGIAVMIAISAMACQFVLFRLAIPQSISTAIMTGGLTDMVLYALDWLSPNRRLMDDERDRLKRSFKLLLGFAIGCVAAGMAIPTMGDWAWVLPAMLAAGAILVR